MVMKIDLSQFGLASCLRCLEGGTIAFERDVGTASGIRGTSTIIHQARCAWDRSITKTARITGVVLLQNTPSFILEVVELIPIEVTTMPALLSCDVLGHLYVHPHD